MAVFHKSHEGHILLPFLSKDLAYEVNLQKHKKLTFENPINATTRRVGMRALFHSICFCLASLAVKGHSRSSKRDSPEVGSKPTCALTIVRPFPVGKEKMTLVTKSIHQFITYLLFTI